MPGDESREEAEAVAKSPTGTGRTRGGPRHAAPRKPLLTRLHVPAGKAIAMAAMPSAVLMGMGLTPQLASAKPLPKNPFRDGPCVSAPDKETEAEKKDKEKDKEKAAEERAAKKKAAKEKAAKEKTEAKPDGDAPSGEDSAGSDSGNSGSTSPGPKPGPDPSESADPEPSDPGPAPEPEPEDDEEWNPLDPLGLGEKLWELLTPEEKKKEREKAAAKEKAAEEKAAKEKAAKEKAAKEQEKSEPEESEPEPEKPGPGGSAEDPADKADPADKGPKDAEKQQPGAPEQDGTPGADGKRNDTAKADKDAGADEDGKKPFPCVEEKKVDGDDEQTPVVLPNQPWYLEATSLALHDLDYEGVVNVKMANGKTKQALKFTSSGLDIGDLHQIVAGPEGTNYHVEAAKGTTSTIRNGRVTMYTERLEGNLFGLIPIVFDPEHPPPLNVPEAYFTKVKVTQAGQFGGTLTIPGLHQSITK